MSDIIGKRVRYHGSHIEFHGVEYTITSTHPSFSGSGKTKYVLENGTPDEGMSNVNRESFTVLPDDAPAVYSS